MRKLQGINTACVVLLVWSYNGYDIYIVGVLSWNLQCVKKACVMPCSSALSSASRMKVEVRWQHCTGRPAVLFLQC